MDSAASDRRAELRRRIQQMQAALSSLDVPAAASAADAEPEEVTLKSVSTQVSDAERRMLGRFNASEKFLLNQLDEQLLGTIMIVGLFILTAFYVFYFLMENLLRLRRCRCPDVTPGDWNVLLSAARCTLAQQASEAVAASAPPAPPATTIVKIVESCAAAGV